MTNGPTISRTPRWLKLVVKVVGSLCALALLLLLGVIGLNCFDETLSPGAAAWLQSPRPSVPPDENGYYALLALGVETSDPVKAGRGIEAALLSMPYSEATAPYDFDQIASRYGKSWSAKLPSCSMKEKNCVDYYIRWSHEFDAAIAAQGPALARYRAMVALPKYEETNNRIITHMAPPMSLGQLSSADITFRLQRGDETAAEWLGQDLRFWTEVMTHSQLLITEMVGVARFNTSAHLAEQLLQRQPTLKAAFRQALLPSLVTVETMDVQDRLLHLKQGEYRYSAYRFDGSIYFRPASTSNESALPESVKYLFLKRNATLNLQYEALSQSLPRPIAGDEIPCAPEWRWLYNPVGHVTVCIGSTGYERYETKLHKSQQLARDLAAQLQ